MLRSRWRSRVRFGFESTAVYSVSPSRTKTIGTTCGRPCGSTVASRATRASAIGIDIARPLPDALRLAALLARDRPRRADAHVDADAQPCGEPLLEPRAHVL